MPAQSVLSLKWMAPSIGWIALVAGHLASLTTPAPAQARFTTDADYMAPAQRPAPEQVADSPFGRLAVARLAARLQADAAPQCAATRKLEDDDFVRRAREIVIIVGWQLRAHSDAAINAEKAATRYEQQAGKGTVAELAVLLDDEIVGRYLTLAADRDAAEFAQEALEHIARALLTAGFNISEDTASLGLGDAASGEVMSRLNVAVDDFLEANRTPEMSRLRELQIASREAIDQAMDQSRLQALPSNALVDAMSGTLAEICILKRP